MYRGAKLAAFKADNEITVILFTKISFPVSIREQVTPTCMYTA